MSEQTDDDEFSAFFNEELRRVEEERVAEAARNVRDALIVAALDEHGAWHIWHPDEAVQADNISNHVQLVEEMNTDAEAESAGLTSKEAIHIRLAHELGMTTLIAIGLIEKQYDGTDASESYVKKVIQARLLVRGFDHGWHDAVNAMFVGEELDITKEEDLHIYIDESADEFLPESDSLKEKFLGIVSNEALSLSDAEQVSRATDIQQLFVYIIGAHFEPVRLPEAEAYIDQLSRTGVLSEDQAVQVRGLLNN